MKFIYNTILISSITLSLFSCSEEKEHMTVANDVTTMNIGGDSIVVSVNGKELYSTKKWTSNVYLTSGEYKVGVKNTNTGTFTEVPVKLGIANDENAYDKRVVRTNKSKGYVLLDMRALYYTSMDLKVEAKYFDQDYFEIPMKTDKFYWPWGHLPETLWSSEGHTALIYKLFEVPAEYKEKSDAEIIAYCEERID